ncbi:class I SAM-dependent rRNA methyltransferase [bacterium]|nr:class I SAM-dependent rRNA methyltransferase [candidate division CSSED10-310 bacterium]
MNDPPRAAVLTDKALQLIREGHAIFTPSSIARVPDPVEPGATVRVLSPAGELIGLGYFNGLSRIPLRILTFTDEPVDRGFWDRRIEAAWRFRRKFYSRKDSFRIVFGEADGFPGLVADWFSGVLVVQITTAGMERQMECVLPVLVDRLSPKAVILSCDSLARKKEGLPCYRRIETGRIDIPFQASVDGIRSWMDPMTGHKTGFFLDHRLNRKRAAEFCHGKRVLDMFCYSGDFGIRAAMAGASDVTLVDIFESALGLGSRTAADHGVSNRCDFIRAEAVDFMTRYAGRDRWDVIFLDPPSWVRGAGRARRNLANYRKVNRLALQCLALGGLLVTSICSYHVSREDFLRLLGHALHEADRTGRIFETGGAGPDHPILPGLEGTDYLKCFFLELED